MMAEVISEANSVTVKALQPESREALWSPESPRSVFKTREREFSALTGLTRMAWLIGVNLVDVTCLMRQLWRGKKRLARTNDPVRELL